jgi:hypothetical protein
MFSILSRNHGQICDLISRVHSQILESETVVFCHLGRVVAVRHAGQAISEARKKKIVKISKSRHEGLVKRIVCPAANGSRH